MVEDSPSPLVSSRSQRACLPLHATPWRSLPATVLAILPVATPVRSAAWLVPSRSHERLPAAALGLHLPRFSPIHTPPWERLSASACPWRSRLRLTPTARSRSCSYARLALTAFAPPPPYEASLTHGVNPPAGGERGCQSSALGVSQIRTHAKPCVHSRTSFASRLCAFTARSPAACSYRQCKLLSRARPGPPAADAHGRDETARCFSRAGHYAPPLARQDLDAALHAARRRLSALAGVPPSPFAHARPLLVLAPASNPDHSLARPFAPLSRAGHRRASAAATRRRSRLLARLRRPAIAHDRRPLSSLLLLAASTDGAPTSHGCSKYHERPQVAALVSVYTCSSSSNLYGRVLAAGGTASISARREDLTTGWNRRKDGGRWNRAYVHACGWLPAPPELGPFQPQTVLVLACARLAKAAGYSCLIYGGSPGSFIRLDGPPMTSLRRRSELLWLFLGKFTTPRYSIAAAPLR
ncbi:hypothetical protein B0H14DRAFT_3521825 [Mycena olivaceomarginata]|nr:hypothetical protein B0H14DRAFT_3521825 [Mycena olivaceomarginata]